MHRLLQLLWIPVLIVFFPVATHALEIPDPPQPKIHKVEVTDIGHTYAFVNFSVKNYDDFDGSIRVIQKRRSKFAHKNGANVYHEDFKRKTAVAINLVPDKRYFFRIQLRNYDNEIVDSYRIKFRTKKRNQIKIDNVSPATVSSLDKLTITGEGFTAFSGWVTIGRNPDRRDGKILSWSPNKIEVQVPYQASDGPLKLGLVPGLGWRTAQPFINIEGPVVDVIDGTNVYNFACSHGVIADSYEAADNIDRLYREEWGRPAQCSEMTFHLQRVTPHDRLRNWLRGEENGVWWQNFKNEYDGKLVYSERTGIWYLKDGVAYLGFDFMTFLAWGLMPDDAIYVADLEDIGVRGTEQIKMKFVEGPRYKKIIKRANRKSVNFKNKKFGKYVNKNKRLIRKNPDDDNFTEDVCDYLECGLLY